MKNYPQAIKTAIIISRQEQELGLSPLFNYRSFKRGNRNKIEMILQGNFSSIYPFFLKKIFWGVSIFQIGNYKVAHSFLVDAYREVSTHMSVPQTLKRSLFLLHSYILVKVS